MVGAISFVALVSSVFAMKESLPSLAATEYTPLASNDSDPDSSALAEPSWMPGGCAMPMINEAYCGHPLVICACLAFVHVLAGHNWSILKAC